MSANASLVSTDAEACVVLAGPRLDDAAALALKDEWTPRIERHGDKTIRLDLSQVDYLSSTAIAVFLTWHKKIEARGGRLVLEKARPFVFEVLSVTGVPRLVRVSPLASQALAC